jgi:hypothetical protein
VNAPIAKPTAPKNSRRDLSFRALLAAMVSPLDACSTKIGVLFQQLIIGCLRMPANNRTAGLRFAATIVRA